MQARVSDWAVLRSRRRIAKPYNSTETEGVCSPSIFYSLLGRATENRKTLMRKWERGTEVWVPELASKWGVWTGTGWQEERASINLGSLCVSLKGGTGLFVGGDPRCLPRKGTAHCFKSRVTWGGHQKGVLKPVRMVKRNECVKTTRVLEIM